MNQFNIEDSCEVNTQKTKVETVEGTREQKSAAGQLQPLTIVQLTGNGARQQAVSTRTFTFGFRLGSNCCDGSQEN